jgi:hypothetical protein
VARPFGGAELVIGSGKAPGEGDRGLLVAALESEQAVLDLAKIGEVVGGQDLPLAHRPVDLDLVQPGRVDRQVHRRRLGQAPQGVLCIG